MDPYNLTDKQFDIAARAFFFPVILRTRGQSITAASLVRNGWGEVEPGASGEKIFRLGAEGHAVFELDQKLCGGAA